MNDYSPTRRADLASSDGSFVGRGFSWPLEVDHTGSIKLTDGADDLDRSIRMVLLTAPGERLMRPDFGCRIWDLLFEPVTANLLGLMAQAVRDASSPTSAASLGALGSVPSGSSWAASSGSFGLTA